MSQYETTAVIDATVNTQPIRVRTVAHFTATYLGGSEFYSGIRSGERVTVKVDTQLYTHGGRVKNSSPCMSIQSIDNPGGWLCLYDSTEKLTDIEPC